MCYRGFDIAQYGISDFDLPQSDLRPFVDFARRRTAILLAFDVRRVSVTASIRNVMIFVIQSYCNTLIIR